MRSNIKEVLVGYLLKDPPWVITQRFYLFNILQYAKRLIQITIGIR